MSSLLLFALPVSREARLHLKPWPRCSAVHAHATGTHRRLVCELHPRGRIDPPRGLGCGWPIEQPTRVSALVRAAAASLTLSPYPRSLAWPRTPFGRALGSQSFRAFPQFGDVASPRAQPKGSADRDPLALSDPSLSRRGGSPFRAAKASARRTSAKENHFSKPCYDFSFL